MPTTIAIDIRVLGTGKTSGVEEYTEQLLAHMIPLDPEAQYKLFYAGRRPLVRRPWMNAPNVQMFDTSRSNRWLWATTRLVGRPHLDELVGGADVFFLPHFLAGATSARCRRILTIHDLSFERFPEFFSRRSLWWHRFQMRPRVQVQLADQIIAVSESTRKDLVSLYHVDPDQVTTVYSGVSPLLKRSSDQEIAHFRRQHQLPEQFILMLGARDPRKNRGVVATAAKILGMPLITHEVAPNERTLWLSAASALAYPSFFEGFGFPPLEAMACGTPALVGANSSMMEVCNDAALAVNPYRISEVSEALAALLNDQALRQVLIARGYERVKQFSWDITAKRTLELLTK